MSVDDELVLTVRIRIKPDEDHEVRLRQIDLASGIGHSLFNAFHDHKVPGDLAGFDVTLPTFAPYPDRPPVQEVPTTQTTQAPSAAVGDSEGRKR